MSRGEVWWVEDAQIGRRPHLVLSRQAAIAVLNAYIAVPATRTVRDLPTEVRLGTEDGMPAECALSLDNVTVIPRSFFVERICRLSTERLSQVCSALGIATGYA